MAQEVAKVDVEELTCFVLKHEVAGVAIADAEDVRGHALAGQRVEVVRVVSLKLGQEGRLARSLREGCLLYVLVPVFLWVGDVVDEVVDHALLVERPQIACGMLLVHLGDHCGLVHELDVPRLEARLHHVVADHRHVQAHRLPDPVHDLEELEHQVILSQVIA